MDSKVLILVLFTILFGCDVRFAGYSEDINGSDAYTDIGYMDTGTNDIVQCEEYRCESYRYLQNPYVYIDRDSGDIYLREYVKEGDRTFILRYDVNGNLIWKRELVYRSKSGEYKPEEGTGCLEVIYVNDDYLQGIVYYGDSYGIGCSGNVAYIIRSELEGDKYVRKWGFGFYPVLMPSISFISLDEESNVYVVGVYERDLELRGIVLHNKSKCIDQGPNGWKCLRDIFVFKFDRDGNILWAKGIGGEGDESAWNGYISDDGLILEVSSSSESIYIDDKKLTVENNGIMIIKLDRDGEYKWSKFSALGYEYMKGIDREGNIYFYGYYDFMNNENNDLFLVKYNKNGELVWSKKVEIRETQSGYELLGKPYVLNLYIDKYQNIYVLGGFTTGSTTDFRHFYYKFLSKYNQKGDRFWYKDIIESDFFGLERISGIVNGDIYLVLISYNRNPVTIDNCSINDISEDLSYKYYLLKFTPEGCSSVEAYK